jgi:hypothetical protein
MVGVRRIGYGVPFQGVPNMDQGYMHERGTDRVLTDMGRSFIEWGKRYTGQKLSGMDGTYTLVYFTDHESAATEAAAMGGYTTETTKGSVWRVTVKE